MENLIIKKAKIGSVLDVTYLSWNESIEDYEEREYKGKEAPHQDLKESLVDLAKRVMQEMDFQPVSKVDNWDEFKIKNVSFDGLQVKADVVFTNTVEGDLEVKCPQTNSVPAEQVETVLAELKDYVSGKKRTQGSLFSEENKAEEESEIEDKAA